MATATVTAFNPKGKSQQAIDRERTRRKNINFASRLIGQGGTLENGATWIITPVDGYPGRIRLTFTCQVLPGLRYGVILTTPAMPTQEILEDMFAVGVQEHFRQLSIRQLEPAQPGAPDGFFVRWKKSDPAAAEQGAGHE